MGWPALGSFERLRGLFIGAQCRAALPWTVFRQTLSPACIWGPISRIPHPQAERSPTIERRFGGRKVRPHKLNKMTMGGGRACDYGTLSGTGADRTRTRPPQDLAVDCGGSLLGPRKAKPLRGGMVEGTENKRRSDFGATHARAVRMGTSKRRGLVGRLVSGWFPLLWLRGHVPCPRAQTVWGAWSYKENRP